MYMYKDESVIGVSKGPRTLQLKLQTNSLSSIHTATFFTTATIFSTVLYMDNDFHNNFFGKIFVKIVVVCKGLKNDISIQHKITLGSWVGSESLSQTLYNNRFMQVLE